MPRRFWVLAVVLACLPDLDIAAFAFGVQYGDFFGHRGVTHSLLVAAVLAGLVGLLAFRELKPGSREWWATTGALFVAAASHGALDAMTNGGLGVAFFSPFDRARYFLPFRPIQVSPLGVTEFLGRWGAATLVNEFLVAVAPLYIAVRVVDLVRNRAAVSRRQVGWVAATVALWFPLLFGAKSAFPELFATHRVRHFKSYQDETEDPKGIPVGDLPEQRLVANFDELKRLGLFDRDLLPHRAPWSSSFFPSWFGGAAGRWRDPVMALLWRTLKGFQPPDAEVARHLLAQAASGDRTAQQQLFRLSPMEKYDLATGDYGLSATRLLLGKTHNARPRPRYWYGLCNGVASAGMAEPEPYRVIEVINPDGFRIPFHPQDVKALLAQAYYYTVESTVVGGVCRGASFDSAEVCSMNPATLVLATLNRIGIAGDSFMVDVHPTSEVQNFAVAGARVSLVKGPYPVGGATIEADLKDRADSLVDVKFHFVMSSTVLTYRDADHVDAAAPDGRTYQHVGVRQVPFDYEATLVLDATHTLIGGKWSEFAADGPDFVSFVSGGPNLEEGERLPTDPLVRWPLIARLAKESAADPGPEPSVRQPLRWP